ncbi:sugar transferase [Echinicola vietnamensis]|uniref:Glycosyl transferase possibly involved in lipopolysaccharide synthesis n=1 Tax=Echinicola vietnamensis (strain DSM 17526 / LMG 23754 / KMM 6221) TaxID=926556 RepID=L0G2H9_ECHVK|nr:sugar transferase [Echinicola vietnamensis]AGA80434.1 glycosyl transferase possibly involved in lipopolysaccharide synthesis [Echinicola vietnamensis DSM 17526]
MTNHNQEIHFNRAVTTTAAIPDLFTLSDMITRDRLQSGILNLQMDTTTKVIKRVFDIFFAVTVLLLGAPVYLALMAMTKLTSKGPIFYKQERIGENGRPFEIYKFRSMYTDAEKNGPQLTRGNDPRVTRWGSFMRKTHLDEIPQFYNVLKGDMSIVGPRPEREHFINQIVSVSPSYKKLQGIKPGITSIGQVYYGYAETVQEMVERMKYDLLYLTGPSLKTDMFIIYQTVKVMVNGKGQ